MITTIRTWPILQLINQYLLPEYSEWLLAELQRQSVACAIIAEAQSCHEVDHATRSSVSGSPPPISRRKNSSSKHFSSAYADNYTHTYKDFVPGVPGN